MIMLKFRSIVKKIVLITIFLCVLFVLFSCSKQTLSTKNREQKVEDTNSGSKKIENENKTILTDEDFIIRSDDTFIQLGEPFDEIKIGKKVLSHEPCNEDQVYDTYFYDDFVLLVSFEPKKGDTIWSIRLLTSEFETSRGVKIGDSISKVFEKYGVIDSDDSDFYYYSQDGRGLTFDVDENEKIIGIKIEKL